MLYTLTANRSARSSFDSLLIPSTSNLGINKVLEIQEYYIGMLFFTRIRPINDWQSRAYPQILLLF